MTRAQALIHSLSSFFPSQKYWVFYWTKVSTCCYGSIICIQGKVFSLLHISRAMAPGIFCIKDILNLQLWITQVVNSLENHKINLLQFYYYAIFLPRVFFFFFFFRLLRNIIVFHLNVSETDIFSVGLYLMSSYRVTEGKAEDSINWMCTWIYKYSSGWVSVHMDKFSAQSLNMVICSLNGLDMSLQKHKC